MYERVQVEYAITGNYVDESKNILEELGLEEEDYEEVEFGADDDDDIQVCEWLFLACIYLVLLRKYTLKLRKNLSLLMHFNNLLTKVLKCHKLTRDYITPCIK